MKNVLLFNKQDVYKIGVIMIIVGDRYCINFGIEPEEDCDAMLPFVSTRHHFNNRQQLSTALCC